jgi:short-subunit dehydrogenase
MLQTLKNETILITGATSGFGESSARLFASLGAKLILTGRRLERLEKLQSELGGDVHIVNHDIRAKNSATELLANLPQEFQNITVLVNNAGLALGLEPAHKGRIADWESMIDTNIKGLLYFTHAILQGMTMRNRGHIVNIGSIAGNYPYPGGNIYAATKAFVRHLSLNLRADLLGTNIKVTNIEPGMAETEFSNIRFKGDNAKADSVYQGMQAIRAEDIADTILWCINRPAHININTIEIMPVAQAFAPFAVSRNA